jgi:hypothetical protein
MVLLGLGLGKHIGLRKKKRPPPQGQAPVGLEKSEKGWNNAVPPRMEAMLFNGCIKTVKRLPTCETGFFRLPERIRPSEKTCLPSRILADTVRGRCKA